METWWMKAADLQRVNFLSFLFLVLLLDFSFDSELALDFE